MPVYAKVLIENFSAKITLAANFSPRNVFYFFSVTTRYPVQRISTTSQSDDENQICSRTTFSNWSCDYVSRE